MSFATAGNSNPAELQELARGRIRPGQVPPST